MSQTRPPAMMDVARVAGVSHQTVSRVLNNPDSVRPITRDKVLAAIEQLGYRRNMSARALVTQHTRVIGVVVADGSFYGPSSTSTAIQRAARQAGYATMVAVLTEGTTEQVAKVIDQLVDHGVEGIIFIAAQSAYVNSLRSIARSVPTVVIADGLDASDGMHVVSVDQAYGARLATQHLMALGHRSILHIAGPQDWYDAWQRTHAWKLSMDAAGLDSSQIMVGDWSADYGYQVGSRLADQGLPDAVFCSNDAMALGLLSALWDLGIKVPQDVSVMGFDDIDGSEYFQPSLTTVRQPFGDLGEQCVSVLVEAIAEGMPVPCPIVPKLMVRRSTAPKRS